MVFVDLVEFAVEIIPHAWSFAVPVRQLRQCHLATEDLLFGLEASIRILVDLHDLSTLLLHRPRQVFDQQVPPNCLRLLHYGVSRRLLRLLFRSRCRSSQHTLLGELLLVLECYSKNLLRVFYCLRGSSE